MGKFIKAILISLGLVAASACAMFGGNSAMTPADQSFVTGCQTYNALLVSMTQYYTSGKLSKQDVATVNQVRAIVYPICDGPVPANMTQATSEILNGISQLQAIKTKINNPVTPTGK